jgi:hypothetical protein
MDAGWGVLSAMPSWMDVSVPSPDSAASRRAFRSTKTKDDDKLKAVWLRPCVLVDGKEVQLPYTANKGCSGKS